MKIIHCSDVHLGSSLTSHFSKEKASERKNELFATFSRMFDYAEQNDVGAVIIAGDLFDTNRGLKTIKKEVLSMIAKHPSVEVYYLKGNHDNLTDNEQLPENVFIFGDKWTTYGINGSDRVKITGVELSKDNVHVVYDLLTLNKSVFNIVVLHGQTAASFGKSDAETIELKSLRGKGIDYLALGHIHAYSGLKELGDHRAGYCYSGCLEGRGFDEPGEHGFVLISIDDESLSYETAFVDFALRHIFHDEVDVSGASTSYEISEKLKEKISSDKCTSKDLAEFILTGELPVDTDIDTDLIIKQLESCAYYVKIKNDTHIELDYSLYEKDESLKGEFVRTVMNDDSLSDEKKKLVIKAGIDALAGREIRI